MAENALEEVFVEELRDLLSAEKQITKALPQMAKKATNATLREAFEQHLKETQEQVHRLEQVFESLNMKARAKTCKAMEGLIAEGKEAIDEIEDSEALDAMLIAAAQKVEHYEIASYGTVCTWAELLGHQEALNLLKQTLGEEEATDKTLTSIALEVNQTAMAATAGE